MFWVRLAVWALANRKGRLDLWVTHRMVTVYMTLLCILNSSLPYSYEAGILENPKVSKPMPGSRLPVAVNPPQSCCPMHGRPNVKFHEGPG